MPSSGTSSILIIRTDQETWGFAAESNADFVARLDPGVEGDLFRLEYDCALDAIGLSPGRLEFSEEADRRPLPAPQTTLATTFDRSGIGTWEPGPAPSNIRLAELVPRCAELEAHSWELSSEHDAGFATALTASSAAVFPLPPGPASLQPVFEASVLNDSLTEIAEVESGRKANRAALREPDGTIWRAGHNRFTVGRFDGDGFLPEMVLDEKQDVTIDAWMDGGPTESGFEVYILTDGPALFRAERTSSSDPTSESLIPMTFPFPSRRIYAGGVAWIRPGEAVVVGLGAARDPVEPDAVAFVRGREISFERIGSGEEVLSDVAYSPGWGLLVGSLNGSVWLKRDRQDDWEQLVRQEDTPCMSAIRSIQPTSRGFVLAQPCGRERGFVVEYVRSLPLCSEVDVANADVTRLLPFESGFVATAREQDEAGFAIIRYATGLPPDCNALGYLD
jgi:hypothetical protein